jgi:hypothetical protein
LRLPRLAVRQSSPIASQVRDRQLAFIRMGESTDA